MLQSFLLLQSVIRDIQHWQKKVDVNLTNPDWTLMEKVVNVLEILFEATVRFSSSSSCITEVIPTVTVQKTSDSGDHLTPSSEARNEAEGFNG